MTDFLTTRRQALILAGAATAAGCAPQGRPSAVLDEAGMQRYLTARQTPTDLVLVSRGGGPANRLNFNWANARTYLEENCAGGNTCPSASYPLDCTHFVCHALNRGGAFIRVPSESCASGLGVRVNDLAESFFNSRSRYANVKQITAHRDTRAGDFCFIPGWFGLTKSHVMVLSAAANPTGASVWGHTNSRCSERVDFEGEACAYYRIE